MTDTIAPPPLLPVIHTSENSGVYKSWACDISDIILTVSEDGAVEEPEVRPEVALCHQLPDLRHPVLWRGDGPAGHDQEVRALVTGQPRTFGRHSGVMITFRANPPRSLTWLRSSICRAGALWRRQATWRYGQWDLSLINHAAIFALVISELMTVLPIYPGTAGLTPGTLWPTLSGWSPSRLSWTRPCSPSPCS